MSQERTILETQTTHFGELTCCPTVEICDASVISDDSIDQPCRILCSSVPGAQDVGDIEKEGVHAWRHLDRHVWVGPILHPCVVSNSAYCLVVEVDGRYVVGHDVDRGVDVSGEGVEVGGAESN